MTKREFSKLKTGDLVLWHNGHYSHNCDFLVMEFGIITCTSKSFVNMRMGELESHFGTNDYEDLELIESGAFNYRLTYHFY